MRALAKLESEAFGKTRVQRLNDAAVGKNRIDKALLLVVIAPGEEPDQAELLLKAARELADALHLDWTVLCVETPSLLYKSKQREQSPGEIFRLAESMGGTCALLSAESPVAALRQYIKLHPTRTVVVGGPKNGASLKSLQMPLASVFVRAGIDVDIIVINRTANATPGVAVDSNGLLLEARSWAPLRSQIYLYTMAFAVSAVCTAIALPMIDHVDLIDMVMIYMLGATLSALRLGRGPAVFCSLANIAAFDYWFIPPRNSFYFSDPHYFVTFGVMLGVALIIANLVSAVRQQTLSAAARERRTEALYTVSKALAVTRDADRMAVLAERHIADVLHSDASVMPCDDMGLFRDQCERAVDNPEYPILQWVVNHRQPAGLGCVHYGASEALYLPLLAGQELRGVLAVRPRHSRQLWPPEQRRLLDAIAGQLALALERVRLGDLAEAAKLSAERASLRNTLLASISHDLRTPLSAIAGAGSMLALKSIPLDIERCAMLGELIQDKARDMTALLSNVLELLRLETNAISIKREWHSVDDLISAALQCNEGRLSSRKITVDLPAELPQVSVEATMIVQLLSNILENCAKYTAPGTTVLIAARTEDVSLLISIEDDGPGFPEGDPERLFDKFERGRSESNVVGVGLGLAICRAVARLHDGEIRAVRAGGGGARFEITLPIGEYT